jgi:hypothetical protein
LREAAFFGASKDLHGPALHAVRESCVRGGG